MYVSCYVGFLLPAVIFVGAAFVKCNAVLSVCLIVIAASILGLSASCWAVNHLDLAPPFAGKHTCPSSHFLPNPAPVVEAADVCGKVLPFLTIS